MTRILFLIQGLHLSAGTERIASDVANSLHQVGMDINFIVLSSSSKSFYNLNDGICVYAINVPFSHRLQAIVKLRRILKKERPDYIVNVGVSMGQISIPATWGLNIKVIGWEHFNLYAGSKLGYYWRLLAAKLSYKTVVLTQNDCRNYLSKVNANVICIPNFITRFIDIKSELTSRTVLSVGRLTAQKGYDLLLQAWKIVINQRPEWKLQIVGSGSDEKDLKLQAHVLNISNSVFFIPGTSDVRQYYENASLYVMSSRFEGMPMVLLEAKMCGVPCISFDCPNGPTEVINNSSDGIIIELGNIERLAEAMLSLMNNEKKLRKYGERAKEDVLKRYTQEIIIKEWLKLFS